VPVVGGGAVAPPSEVHFATPASFAVIQNNTALMAPETAVSHRHLGINGVKLTGRQPFATIYPVWAPAPPIEALNYFRPATSTADLIDTFHIAINPLAWNGALAQKAAEYERFVFRRISIIGTAVQGTSFVGVGVLCIENDPVNLIPPEFQTLAMVDPVVRWPYRVPQMRLNWGYEGPELYYCCDVGEANLAVQRQIWQGVISGADSGANPTADATTTYLDIEYEIELYDPVPPIGAPASRREREIVRSFLDGYRNKGPVLARPRPPVSKEELALVAKLGHDLREAESSSAESAAAGEGEMYRNAKISEAAALLGTGDTG